MKISDANSIQSSPEWRKSLDYAMGTTDFQRRLAEAQSGTGQSSSNQASTSSAVGVQTAATPESVAATSQPLQSSLRTPAEAARYELNGVDVGFDQLPAATQQLLRQMDQKRAECEAYQAEIGENPDIGPQARLRPYDEAQDGWAMRRLAAMDPATAHMTPQEYYNYEGSDRQKYDMLIRTAKDPFYDRSKRVFGTDVEQESKVQFVRDLWATGKQLPKTFAELETIWRAEFVRQQAAGSSTTSLPPA